jgi:hypothetical protein
VIVPLRDDVEALVEALNVAEPEPVPPAPGVTVSQVALLAAVHAQPVTVVTATVDVPPAERIDVTVRGETRNAQGAAAWVTVNA